MWLLEKGGSGMNYQESLRRMYELLGKIPYEVELSDLNPLRELVFEKLEQESRKDKLIVGSQWECVAENRGRNTVFKKGIETYILEIEENFITFGHGTVYGYVRDSAPIDQFLLCFKPIKEGSE